MQTEVKQVGLCKEIYSECSFLKIVVIPTKPDFPQFFFHPPIFFLLSKGLIWWWVGRGEKGVILVRIV